jgi:hypothetical protein
MDGRVMTPFRRAARVLAAVALLGGCRAEGPEPTAVVPDHGPADAPVRVIVRGRGLEPAVATDFTHADDGRLDGRFALRLGETALRDVELRPDGALEALVPAGLGPGAYDLTVVRPDGREGSLGAAYRALAPGPGDDVVSALRVEVPEEVTAGTPFQVSVTALDARGDPALDFGGRVELTDRTHAVVPARAELFARGHWSGAVEVRASSAADVLVATVSGGASGSSVAFVVRPAPATALAFVTPPLVATAGSCSGPVVLALLDRFQEPTAASAPLALALDLPTGMSAFADDGCEVPLTTTLAPFDHVLLFHLRATSVGPFTVVASGGGLTGASFTGEVVPAAAAKLVLDAPVPTVAGICTPAAVLVQDAFGNATPAVDLPVGVDAVPRGGVALFAGASCDRPLAAVRPGTDGRAAFSFIETVAWPLTLTAAAPGLPPSIPHEVVVAPNVAVQVSFVSPPRTAKALRCSPALTILARDAFGNAAPVAVTLTVSGAPAATFFADAECRSALGDAPLALANGTLDVYLLAPAGGTYDVGVSAPPLSEATQQVEVAP